MRALVTDWAEQGNTDLIPEAKITADIARTAATEALASAIASENTGRTGADNALGTRIDGLVPRVGRLVPLNDWVRNDEAHSQLFAWFPTGAVASGVALAFSIGGVPVRITSPDGYSATDINGLILTVPVSASNSATITREANTRAGHIRVDLSVGGTAYHCYIPAVAEDTGGGGTSEEGSGKTLLFSGNADIAANTWGEFTFTTTPTADNAQMLLFEIEVDNNVRTFSRIYNASVSWEGWQTTGGSGVRAGQLRGQNNQRYLSLFMNNEFGVIARNQDDPTKFFFTSSEVNFDGEPMRVWGISPRGPKGDPGEAAVGRTTVLVGPTGTAAAATATTTTLPTDYGTYGFLEVVAVQSAGGTGAANVPCAVLAAATANQTYSYPSTQNGTTGTVTWNPSTRAFTADSGTFVYVALIDAGARGPKGDKGDQGDPVAPTKQLMATGQALPVGTYELLTSGYRDVSGRRHFYSHTLPIELLEVGRASRIYLGEANPASPRDTNDVYIDLALASDRTLTFASGGIAGWTVRLYAVRA